MSSDAPVRTEEDLSRSSNQVNDSLPQAYDRQALESAALEPAGYLVRHQFAVVLAQSNNGCANFLRLANFLEKISSLYSFEIAKPARSVKELEHGDEMKDFLTAYTMTETLAMACCALVKNFHHTVSTGMVEPMMLHYSTQAETLRNIEKQEKAHQDNYEKLQKSLLKEHAGCDRDLKVLQAAVKEAKAAQMQWTLQGWVEKEKGKDKGAPKLIQKEKLARSKVVKAFAAYEALFVKTREAENALYSFLPNAIKIVRQVDRERLSLSKFYMSKFATLFSSFAGSLKTMNMTPVLNSLSDEASMQRCLDMWCRVHGEPPPLERVEFKLPCTSDQLSKFDDVHVGDESELKLPANFLPLPDVQQEAFRQTGLKAALVSASIPTDYYTSAKQQEIAQKIRAMELEHRLLDYFLVFGRGALTNSSFENAEHDFEQDLSLRNLKYEGVLLQRYPAWEWSESPMAPNLPMFAFPMGSQLVVGVEGPALQHARRPRMFRFMCTKMDGTRQHCSALVIYEKVSPKALIALYDGKIKKLDEAIAHHAHLLAEKEVGILTDHRTRATIEKLGAQIAAALSAGQAEAAIPLKEQRDKLIESLDGKLFTRRQLRAAVELENQRLQQEKEWQEEELRREQEERQKVDEEERRKAILEERKKNNEDSNSVNNNAAGDDERRSNKWSNLLRGRRIGGEGGEELSVHNNHSQTSNHSNNEDSLPIGLGDFVELYGLSTESYNGQKGVVIAVYENRRFDVTLESKEIQRFKEINLRKLTNGNNTPLLSPVRPKRPPPLPPGPPPPLPTSSPPSIPEPSVSSNNRTNNDPMSDIHNFLPSSVSAFPWSSERADSKQDEGEDMINSEEKSMIGSSLFAPPLSPLASHTYLKDAYLEEVVYEPKVICLVSSHPFCGAMEGFLRAFHHSNTSSLPFERLLSNVMHEIPVPPRGNISVRWQAEENSEETVIISRAPTNKLPEVDCDFRYLFRSLDHDTILSVFIALATEQRVIFTCDSLQMLVHVSETFLNLLFPFVWQGVYMPILPETLWDFLYAPVPFIAGVHSAVLRNRDVPEDILLVDLDSGELRGSPASPLPTLEPSSARKLLAQLKKYADIKQKNRDFIKRADDAFGMSQKVDDEMKAKKPKDRTKGPSAKEMQRPSFPRRTAREPETPRRMNHKELATMSQLRAIAEMEQRQNFDVTEIRQAFLRFWVKLLMKYSGYLKPWSGGLNGEEETLEACFDINKFVEASPAGARMVLSEICHTQMCWNFVGAKLDGMKKGATMPPYILFFDECIVEKENRSTTKLVKDSTSFLHEASHSSIDFFDAPSPNMEHLIENGPRQPWPLFDPKLFLPLRYVQPLAELDTKKRQLETAWYDHSLLPHTPSRTEEAALEETINQFGPSRSRGSVVAKGQALAALFSQAISEREAIAAVTSLWSEKKAKDTPLLDKPEPRRSVRRQSVAWGGEKPAGAEPPLAFQLKAAKAEIEELKRRIAELEATKSHESKARAPSPPVEKSYRYDENKERAPPPPVERSYSTKPPSVVLRKVSQPSVGRRPPDVVLPSPSPPEKETDTEREHRDTKPPSVVLRKVSQLSVGRRPPDVLPTPLLPLVSPQSIAASILALKPPSHP